MIKQQTQQHSSQSQGNQKTTGAQINENIALQFLGNGLVGDRNLHLDYKIEYPVGEGTYGVVCKAKRYLFLSQIASFFL